MGNRLIEVNSGNTWLPTTFENVKVGDRVRMYEKDNTPIIWQGAHEVIVVKQWDGTAITVNHSGVID